ncbi:hypothetical protein [Thauera sp. SDU_THAU2]|uniref:hypothetical protein n=1 Tax=Thauera sp. SDU_THAU2 TaxID=3136633 RepID=UPI00311E154C
MAVVYNALDRLVEEVGLDARHTRYLYDPTGLILGRLEEGYLTAQPRLGRKLVQAPLPHQ